MSDSQSSSVPETPSRGGDLTVAQWSALVPPNINEPPDTWLVGTLLFYRRDRRAGVRRGGKISPIWEAGTWYTVVDSDRPLEAWLCNRCQSFVRLTAGSSSNALAHWRTAHQDVPLGSTTTPTSPVQRRSATPMGQRLLYRDVNVSRWRAKMMRWLIQEHMPFAQVDSECFREVLMELYPPIKDYLITGKTIRRWLDDEYEAAVERIRCWLRDASSRVHISFDIWTSPNGFAMLGTYAHFVSGYTAEVQSVVLAMRRLEGSHSGEEVALLLAEILRFWHLEKQVGVFVADNVETNDVAINRLVYELQLPPAVKRRSRCLGHIINLAAKAFLFGKDVEVFDMGLESGTVSLESSSAQKRQLEWRKKGPVGKLHNLVHFVRSSTLRREAFRRCCLQDSGDLNNLELRPDNATRWNSTWHMIERALLLENRLRLFVQDPNYRSEIAEDILSDHDWSALREIAEALKPFHQATLRLQGAGRQGHHGSIWEALPALEFLLKHVERGAPPDRLKRPSALQVAYQNAWQKLQKYYNKTDDCHEIYAAGVLFNPCHRRSYFDIRWTTPAEREYKELMLQNVKTVWTTRYLQAEAHFETKVYEEDTPAKRQKRELSPDAIEKDLQAMYEAEYPAAADEFDAYINGARLNPKEITNLISWWQDRTASHNALKQQALDVLSIPAMSTDCERLFSSAADLVGVSRYSLHPDTMERLELLRQWLREGLVELRGGEQ